MFLIINGGVNLIIDLFLSKTLFTFAVSVFCRPVFVGSSDEKRWLELKREWLPFAANEPQSLPYLTPQKRRYDDKYEGNGKKLRGGESGVSWVAWESLRIFRFSAQCLSHHQKLLKNPTALKEHQRRSPSERFKSEKSGHNVQFFGIHKIPFNNE